VPDKYGSFADLSSAERPGSYAIAVRDLATEIIVAAPHGGGIEPGTSEIALAIAGDDLSYYLFEGRKRDGNGVLHITSTNFDEPRGRALFRAAGCVLAIHGEASGEEVVYLGGLNASLKVAVAGSLILGGYTVLEHKSPYLQGLDKKNLCNIGRAGAGVQLEISAGLRRSFFSSLTRAGRRVRTDRLAEFSARIRSALDKART
jgi:phage replication-related protein YjqB (UPF0714/DUF867 family)